MFCFSFFVFAPYFGQEGKRGYLEGLAAHYSKHLTLPYEDVLDGIEQVRLSKWKERHVRIATGHTISRQQQRSGERGGDRGIPIGSSIIGSNIANQSNLPSSHSQPLYVPGKYSVRILALDIWLRYSSVLFGRRRGGW